MRASGSPPASLLTILAAVALLQLSIPHSLPAQDSAWTSTLLKRVASAVDGYRNGRRIWLVVARQFPHDVHGVFFTSQDASAAVQSKGRELYGSFGPFLAELDGSSPALMYGVVCKRPDTSSCPHNPLDSILPTPIDSIEMIRITFEKTDGRSTSTAFRPQGAEAVFFTMSAVDKLLIPYYTLIYGVDYAEQEREEYLRRFTQRRPR